MNCAVHTQTQAAAFCRTCGKALCEDCKRDVMGAIYCEPCIAARLQSNVAPGAPAMPPPPPSFAPAAPSPGLAGLLGFIPGVGAMYNGQFVKAFVHVAIFVMLILITERIGPAGILIAFFIFYMAFEAYKTAESRRLVLPAPDPLGLDKMFGLQESQPPASINTNVAGAASVQIPPQPQGAPTPQDNVPMGAIVLLILGVVFLLSNFNLMRVGRLWPLVLIGLGLWIAYKRTSQQA